MKPELTKDIEINGWNELKAVIDIDRYLKCNNAAKEATINAAIHQACCEQCKFYEAIRKLKSEGVKNIECECKSEGATTEDKKVIDELLTQYKLQNNSKLIIGKDNSDRLSCKSFALMVGDKVYTGEKIREKIHQLWLNRKVEILNERTDKMDVIFTDNVEFDNKNDINYQYEWKPEMLIISKSEYLKSRFREKMLLIAVYAQYMYDKYSSWGNFEEYMDNSICSELKRSKDTAVVVFGVAPYRERGEERLWLWYEIVKDEVSTYTLYEEKEKQTASAVITQLMDGKDDRLLRHIAIAVNNHCNYREN